MCDMVLKLKKKLNWNKKKWFREDQTEAVIEHNRNKNQKRPTLTYLDHSDS